MMVFRKILFFSFGLMFLSACFADKKAEEVSKKSKQEIVIVDSQGRVCPQMLQLLSLSGITHDASLQDIVTQTQKSWLRKPGSERWDMPSTNVSYEQDARALINAMGIDKEVRAQKKTYTYLLVLGALFSTVALRMEYAADLWKSGVRFDEVVLLGGARPMASEQGENYGAFLKWSGKSELDYEIQTETDLLKFVYEYTQMPVEMRTLPVVIIDVPMLQKVDGSMRRPTTGDTIEWWLKTNPTPGTCLAVSNQPFVAYQAAVLKTLLPSEFPVEVVGGALAENKELGVLFDTLARVLYQEQQYLLKQGAQTKA